MSRAPVCVRKGVPGLVVEQPVFFFREWRHTLCQLSSILSESVIAEEPSDNIAPLCGRKCEESYRIMVYGTAARGLPTDGPFDEDTGLGFVPQRSGHYSDALARGKKVIALRRSSPRGLRRA